MSILATSRWLRWVPIVAGFIGSAAFGQPPYGLDTRAPIGPYLNNIMPPASTGTFPPVLSATGAFSNLTTLTPSTGLIPFAVNSPLWSDGALKTRWIAVPNDGPPYTSDEQISFVPVGEWSFPNGTVFVKHFELTVNEITGDRKRLETRFLVRNQDGAVYGVTYKWRADNSDADLLPGALDEDIAITTSTGTRIQKWSYPSRSQCLFCHNATANYVLGVKTHQMNGDFTYPATGQTDNQVRTFAHIGLLNPAPNEGDIPTFLKTVAVTDTSVPVQYRMRSWIDANCSHCHRPGGFGPGYDGRFYTPIENQDLVDTFVRFRDVEGSPLYQRDNSLGDNKMPPLAKNVVHEAAMTNLRQWIASPLEVLSVYLYQDTAHLAVRFNSHLDPATATVASNYYLVQPDIPVTEAVMSAEPDTVILTLAPLTPNQTYYLTTSNVQDTAPSSNTIWLRSQTTFVAEYRPAVTGSRLLNISTRLQVGVGDDVLIGGFIVRGSPSKRIMIRAIGPSLSSSGIANALGDPVLELHDSTGAVIATDDDWADNANQQEIIDTGIAPTSPKESVTLARLPSDDNGVAYTAVLSGVGATTGVGLLEVYDLEQGLGPKVLNISTRGRVDLGESAMIGGFIVGGPASQRVIVRAIGPSLPVAGQLADPTLELHDGNGGLLASNNNWRSNQEAEIIATTIPPTNDFESAIVATLLPGNYTAVVRGVDNTTGVALVEVFALN